jgi:hypothetical protein
MSKQQMIEQIRQQNRSASNEFLLGFDEPSLHSYLQRLMTLRGHRGRSSIWVRQTTSRSVTAHACA